MDAGPASNFLESTSRLMSIDALPEHIRRPHLRPIQPIPLSKDGRQFIALRDPASLCPQTMVVPMPALQILQQFRGDRPIDQIATQARSELMPLVELAKALDSVGLLWGPTFEQLEAKLLEKLRTQGAFPANASSALGTD